MRFYPQGGKGQALALPGALALGREGEREALVTSTLAGRLKKMVWLHDNQTSIYYYVRKHLDIRSFFFRCLWLVGNFDQ